MNIFFGSFLSNRDILLLISDILLVDSDNESIIDLIVSINLLSIPDKLSTRFDNESDINL